MRLSKCTLTFAGVYEVIQGTEEKHNVSKLVFLIQRACIPNTTAGNSAIRLSSLLNKLWNRV
jgi:hypothetical protein